MEKFYRVLVVFVFFITISVFSIYYVVFKPSKTQSVLEARTLAKFNAPTISGIASGDFQDNFEKAFSDQIPKRDTLLLLTAKIDRAFTRAGYSIAPDIGYPLAKAANSPYLYNYHGQRFLLATPARFYKVVDDAIKTELSTYDKLIRELPDTRFFASLIEPAYNAAINPLNPYFENPVNGRYLKTFIENAPQGMKLSVLEPHSMDEYLSYFYKTDHHWKAQGILKVYEDLYPMLSSGVQDFPSKLKINGIKDIKQAPFRGSFARLGLYPNISEYISAVDAEESDLEVYVNGKPSARSRKSQILGGSFKRGLFTNLYGEYYGDDFALVVYKNKRPANRNLLIIGPSYTQAIEPLLASHYKETYSIDLRHYEKFAGKPLNLKNYIKENKIDDVLLMVEPQLISSKIWQPEK
jgi:hypothetical protein